MINRGTRNIDTAGNTTSSLLGWYPVFGRLGRSLHLLLHSWYGLINLWNFLEVIVTTRAHSQRARETIFARWLVTIVWYLKANLMAMKRSTLIKARWRMMTETRKNVKVPITLLRTGLRKQWLASYFKLKWIMSRMLGIASKPSAVDKLTRMMLDAVRR